MDLDRYAELFKPDNFDHEVVGARLRGCRQYAGLSQEELGKIVDLTKATISGLEHGRSRPGFELMMYFDRFHDIDPSFIISGKYSALPVEALEGIASAMAKPARIRA